MAPRSSSPLVCSPPDSTSDDCLGARPPGTRERGYFNRQRNLKPERHSPPPPTPLLRLPLLRSSPRAPSRPPAPSPPPALAATAGRHPGRQRALPHTLRPFWPSASRWPRKVTWTRKWSSSRWHRWEQGAGLRVRPAGGREAAVSHLQWQRGQVLSVGCESGELTSGFSALPLPVSTPQLGPV